MTVEQRFNRRQITLRCRVITQVYRVAGLDKFGQSLAKLRQDLVAQLRQLAITAQQLVQSHSGRCRTVADDHQPLAAQRVHMAQGLYCGEQLMGILHAQQTGALDSGIVGGIQPLLAVKQQLGLLAAAAFDHQNRFVA
ncbi:hypothetical protein D3C75_986910 [compost metagenome]